MKLRLFSALVGLAFSLSLLGCGGSENSGPAPLTQQQKDDNINKMKGMGTMPTPKN